MEESHRAQRERIRAMIAEERAVSELRDEMEEPRRPYDYKFRVDEATEPVWGGQLPRGQGYTLNTHRPEDCAGRNCVIHNPSDHRMKDWPLNWRSDRGLMERTCEHFCAHPDPDDIAYKVSIGLTSEGIHGCDGCCRDDA